MTSPELDQTGGDVGAGGSAGSWICCEPTVTGASVQFGYCTVTGRIGHYSEVAGEGCAVGWVWVVVVVGSLVGCAAWADRRRYRGVPVPTELSGRPERKAVRLSRARMAHLETPARYSGYTVGGDSGD